MLVVLLLGFLSLVLGYGPAAAAPAVIVATPTLTWTYDASAPERFVIRRSLDGGTTWHEVGEVAGTSGSDLTWQDTTLPPSTVPFVVQYAVFAVVGTSWSETSNRAIGTYGGAPRRPSASVSVVRADSAATQNPAALAGDGLPATFWHTKHSTSATPLPHWIVLDLGAVVPVDGLAYLPRQDTSRNGTIAQYTINVSRDNKTWSDPVAAGVWIWGPLQIEQYVRWPAVEARYVKLTARKEISGGAWTSAAEIALYAESPAAAGVALGTCVMVQQDAKTTITTCVKP